MNILDRLFYWLEDHMPVQCANCGKWLMKCNSMYEWHQTAGEVPICPKCHDMLYRPIGSKINKSKSK